MDPGRLAEQAAALGAALDEGQLTALQAYHEALLSSPHNVTALSADAIVDELFLDSLAGVSLVSRFDGPIVDLGSGGGVPGIPLAVALPTRSLVLMDANGKKMSFVQSVIERLGLRNVETRCARAEEAGRDPEMREHFGVAVSKAVAPLRVLVEWVVPLLRPGGCAVCWKGPAAAAEIVHAETALQSLGAVVEASVSYRVGGREPRSLVVVRRQGALDARFPRRPGVASKRPL